MTSAAGPSSERSSKRVKTSDAFDPSQRIVEIVLESEDKGSSYNIHENLLRQNSKYFDERILKLQKRKPIVVKDVSTETFLAFARWLYSKELDIEEDDSRLESNEADDQQEPGQSGDSEAGNSDNDGEDEQRRTNHTYMRLIELYSFANSFQATLFKNAIMLRLQGFLTGSMDDEDGSETLLPSMEVVKHAFDTIEHDSGLCRFLSASFGEWGSTEDFESADYEGMPSSFLAQVLRHSFRSSRSPYGSNHDPGIRQNWCAYHDHEGNDEARSLCRKLLPVVESESEDEAPFRPTAARKTMPSATYVRPPLQRAARRTPRKIVC